MDFYWESERLVITQLKKADAYALFEMYADAEAMKFRASKPLKTIEGAHEMISNQCSKNGSISKNRFGIRTQSNHRLIGTLLLKFDIEASSKCEIGLSLGREFWRKGYGRDTLKMVEEHLLNDGKIKVMEAWCMNENLASIKLFQKSGFIEKKQDKYPKSKLLVKQIKDIA